MKTETKLDAIDQALEFAWEGLSHTGAAKKWHRVVEQAEREIAALREKAYKYDELSR